MPAPTGTGLIAGQVVDVASNESTGGIQVILIDQESNFEWRVNADSKGRFFFGRLPAGAFAIQTVAVDTGDTIASTATGIGRRVTLTEGERVTDLRIGILRFGTASGVVRDDVGDPAVGMTVVAFQRLFSAGRIVYPARGRARTDDRGEFQLSLVPGEYLICACQVGTLPVGGGVFSTLEAEPLNLMAAARRGATLGPSVLQTDDTMRMYAPAFHPSSPTAARAERVVIASGEDKVGVDIGVTAVRAARVSGRVVGVTGALLPSSVHLQSLDEASPVTMPYVQPAVEPDGRFDFTGVPPGEYTLKVRHIPRVPSAASSGPEWAHAQISVGDRDITGLVVPIQPTVAISGRVEFTGSTAPPAEEQAKRLMVGIESATRLFGEQDFGAMSTLVIKEHFTLTGVSPGQYLLRSSGVAPWSTLTSVTAGGRDVTDLPVEIGPTGLRDVVMTFDDAAMSRLPGRLVGGRELTGADAFMVVAFPGDRRLWINPGSRRFRSSGVDQKGAFTLTALPPGDYYLAAIEDRFGVIWQDANNLERLARTAARVTVIPGLNPTLEIRR
jgi:hypothetical protein